MDSAWLKAGSAATVRAAAGDRLRQKRTWGRRPGDADVSRSDLRDAADRGCDTSLNIAATPGSAALCSLFFYADSFSEIFLAMT